MLIMHGRRRVGKSFLWAHFASNHNQDTVFFTADKGREKDNVQRFCTELKRVLNAGDFLDSLETWQSVYSFIESTEITKRITIIIDEFTYLYNSNPAYDSGLQNAIDRIFKNKNILPPDTCSTKLIPCSAWNSRRRSFIRTSCSPSIQEHRHSTTSKQKLGNNPHTGT